MEASGEVARARPAGVFARGQAELEIRGELLAHVPPLDWEHINLTGEYRWPGADRRAPRNA